MSSIVKGITNSEIAKSYPTILIHMNTLSVKPATTDPATTNAHNNNIYNNLYHNTTSDIDDNKTTAHHRPQAPR